MRPHFLLLPLAFCACASGKTGNPALDDFPPGVVGGTEITYYDIQGSTAPQLVTEMRKLGPKVGTGSFFGEAQSPLRFTQGAFFPPRPVR